MASVVSIRCMCACHRGSTLVLFVGADVTDPIDAATACDSCRGEHCPALLPKALANEVAPVPPKPAAFCYEDSDDGE